jgi:trigger factor
VSRFDAGGLEGGDLEGQEGGEPAVVAPAGHVHGPDCDHDHEPEAAPVKKAPKAKAASKAEPAAEEKPKKAAKTKEPEAEEKPKAKKAPAAKK